MSIKSTCVLIVSTRASCCDLVSVATTRYEPLEIGVNNGSWVFNELQLAWGGLAIGMTHCGVALAVAFVAVAIILGAGRPSARRASPEDDSADDGRMKRPELPTPVMPML